MAEEEKEKPDQKENSSGGNLTGAEGVLMLMAGGLLDCAGFVIALAGTWVGIDDYGILDIFGFLIIGGWMLMRGMSAGSMASKAKGSIKRFVGASVVEVIPVVGGISPSWTWLVWKELKGKK